MQDDPTIVLLAPCCSRLVQAIALVLAPKLARARPRRRAGGRARLPAARPPDGRPVAGLLVMGSLAAQRPPRSPWSAWRPARAGGHELLHQPRSRTRRSRWPWRSAPGRSARPRATAALAIDEEARRAVGDEQARIARELHDVIAHSVSVIVVQAAAADDVFDERPDQARAALRSIERAGREALGELRRLLGAVRPAATASRRARSPGLDRARRAGRAAARRRLRGGRCAARASAAPLPRRRRPVRLPDRAGGADEHAAPRARDARRGDRALRADAVELDVRDDGRGGRGRRARPAAAGSSGCASAPRCSAARSTPGRCRAAASASTPACRWRRRRERRAW